MKKTLSYNYRWAPVDRRRPSGPQPTDPLVLVVLTNAALGA